MGWLAGYHVVIDCFNKTVRLRVDETDKNAQFISEQKKIKTLVISELKANIC